MDLASFTNECRPYAHWLPAADDDVAELRQEHWRRMCDLQQELQQHVAALTGHAVHSPPDMPPSPDHARGRGGRASTDTSGLSLHQQHQQHEHVAAMQAAGALPVPPAPAPGAAGLPPVYPRLPAPQQQQVHAGGGAEQGQPCQQLQQRQAALVAAGGSADGSLEGVAYHQAPAVPHGADAATAAAAAAAAAATMHYQQQQQMAGHSAEEGTVAQEWPANGTAGQVTLPPAPSPQASSTGASCPHAGAAGGIAVPTHGSCDDQHFLLMATHAPPVLQQHAAAPSATLANQYAAPTPSSIPLIPNITATQPQAQHLQQQPTVFSQLHAQKQVNEPSQQRGQQACHLQGATSQLQSPSLPGSGGIAGQLSQPKSRFVGVYWVASVSKFRAVITEVVAGVKRKVRVARLVRSQHPVPHDCHAQPQQPHDCFAHRHFTTAVLSSLELASLITHQHRQHKAAQPCPEGCRCLMLCR